MQLVEAHIAYCEYFATGEGVRMFIALGGSYSSAERIFKKNVPEYFHSGLFVYSLGLERNKMLQILPLIPQPVMDLMMKNPINTTEYFSMVHYNLS